MISVILRRQYDSSSSSLGDHGYDQCNDCITTAWLSVPSVTSASTVANLPLEFSRGCDAAVAGFSVVYLHGSSQVLIVRMHIFKR